MILIKFKPDFSTVIFTLGQMRMFFRKKGQIRILRASHKNIATWEKKKTLGPMDLHSNRIIFDISYLTFIYSKVDVYMSVTK